MCLNEELFLVLEVYKNLLNAGNTYKEIYGRTFRYYVSEDVIKRGI